MYQQFSLIPHLTKVLGPQCRLSRNLKFKIVRRGPHSREHDRYLLITLSIAVVGGIVDLRTSPRMDLLVCFSYPHPTDVPLAATYNAYGFMPVSSMQDSMTKFLHNKYSQSNLCLIMTRIVTWTSGHLPRASSDCRIYARTRSLQRRTLLRSVSVKIDRCLKPKYHGDVYELHDKNPSKRDLTFTFTPE